MNWDYTFTLGPVNLPLWITGAVLAYLSFSGVLSLLFSGDKESRKKIEDSSSLAFFLGLGVWKLTPLLLNFERILKDPILALYLPGGFWGTLLGTVAALGLLLFKAHRQGWISPPKLLKLGTGLGAALGAFLLVGLVGGQVLVPQAMPLKQGQNAPILLNTLQGSEQNLTEAPDKVLVLNFWATWCPPCRAEIPEMNAFWKDADQSLIEIRGVNLFSTEKSLQDVQDFVEKLDMKFPIFLDTGEASAYFAVVSVPTTLVFDYTGLLKERKVGVLQEGDLERWLKAYSKPQTF